MNNKGLIERLRKPTAMPLKLCNEAATALEQADAEIAELRAQVERAREALKRISVPIAFALPRMIDPERDAELIARMDHAREALSTLTTGNAVKQIEARVLMEAALFAEDRGRAANEFDARVEALTIAAELRKLAEQMGRQP